MFLYFSHFIIWINKNHLHLMKNSSNPATTLSINMFAFRSMKTDKYRIVFFCVLVNVVYVSHA